MCGLCGLCRPCPYGPCRLLRWGPPRRYLLRQQKTQDSTFRQLACLESTIKQTQMRSCTLMSLKPEKKRHANGLATRPPEYLFCPTHGILGSCWQVTGRLWWRAVVCACERACVRVEGRWRLLALLAIFPLASGPWVPSRPSSDNCPCQAPLANDGNARRIPRAGRKN